MPLYAYYCPHCPNTWDEFKTVGQRNRVRCPSCCKPGRQDFQRKQIADQGGIEPFFSEAMGCGAVAERLPGEVYDNQHRIQVRSRGHKRRLQKQLGLVDRKSFVQ